VIQEKTHVALDTDWMTAAFIAFCFVLCLLTIAATTRQVLVGGPVKAGVTWDTVFLFLAFGSLALRVRERIMKSGAFCLASCLDLVSYLPSSTRPFKSSFSMHRLSELWS
jgi:hypothetical protein